MEESERAQSCPITMLAKSFAFRGTVNPSQVLPGKAIPQKALSGVGWDGHAVGTAWGWPGNQVLGAKPRGEMGASQPALPSPGCLQLWELGWGSCRGWGLPAAQGTAGDTGPYLFRVVPREDAVPMELLQNILELLAGVWGDKGTVLSVAPLGCPPHPPAGWCRGAYLLHVQFLDPSVPGRGPPCPASSSTFRGQGRHGKLAWELYI